jgi:hypothetical protein
MAAVFTVPLGIIIGYVTSAKLDQAFFTFLPGFRRGHPINYGYDIGRTADSALALGDALGTGPEFWLNLQRDWNLWHSMRAHKRIPKMKKIVSQQAISG